MSDTKMTTPTREQEIAARCEAATKGPWRSGIEGNFRIYGPDGQGEGSGVVAECGHRPVQFVRRANVAFIAHARLDIPYLLDTIRGLREQVEGLKQERYSICHCEQCCEIRALNSGGDHAE